MSLLQEFQSGLEVIVEEDFEAWIDAPDFVDSVVDAVMQLADELGIFRST